MELLEKWLLEAGISHRIGAVYLWTAFAIIKNYRKVPIGLYQKVADLEGSAYDAVRNGIKRIVPEVWKQAFPNNHSNPTTKEFIENLWDLISKSEK